MVSQFSVSHLQCFALEQPVYQRFAILTSGNMTTMSLSLELFWSVADTGLKFELKLIWEDIELSQLEVPSGWNKGFRLMEGWWRNVNRKGGHSLFYNLRIY